MRRVTQTDIRQSFGKLENPFMQRNHQPIHVFLIFCHFAYMCCLIPGTAVAITVLNILEEAPLQ